MQICCVHLLTIDTKVTEPNMRSLRERVWYESIFFNEAGKQCTEADENPIPSPAFQLISGSNPDDDLIIEYSTQEHRSNRQHRIATTLDALRPEQLPRIEEFIDPGNAPVRIFFWMPTIDDVSALANLLLIGEAIAALLREKRTHVEQHALVPVPEEA